MDHAKLEVITSTFPPKLCLNLLSRVCPPSIFLDSMTSKADQCYFGNYRKNCGLGKQNSFHNKLRIRRRLKKKRKKSMKECLLVKIRPGMFQRCHQGVREDTNLGFGSRSEESDICIYVFCSGMRVLFFHICCASCQLLHQSTRPFLQLKKRGGGKDQLHPIKNANDYTKHMILSASALSTSYSQSSIHVHENPSAEPRSPAHLPTRTPKISLQHMITASPHLSTHRLIQQFFTLSLTHSPSLTRRH